MINAHVSSRLTSSCGPVYDPSMNAKKKPHVPERKRTYLSQTDVPAFSLEQAMRVPKAMVDEHAGKPTKPLDVAHAMKVQPGSGPFRMLCGAAIAYGLTEGGYNADVITLTDLGRRVVTKGIEDPDGIAARREAALRPRVVREFFQKYDGSKMPREDVALKVLESLQVPQDALKRAWGFISEVAKEARFLKEINAIQYVDLQNTVVETAQTQENGDGKDSAMEEEERAESHSTPPSGRVPLTPLHRQENGDPREKRVFVTHGKNREFIPQIKELLEFGQFVPVVSIERESVSKPIPDKVMDVCDPAEPLLFTLMRIGK